MRTQSQKSHMSDSPKKKGQKKNNKVVSKKKIWKRLSEVYPNNSIVKISDAMRKDKKLLFEDIEQGDIGDCYLLCVLCAMCEFPDKIIDLFPSNSGVIKNGCIEVELYIHGVPTKICLDDYLPFITFEDDDPDSQDPTFPCFAKVSNISGNLWPSIIEKVWAKLNLSYSGITKGSCGEAFEVLFPADVGVDGVASNLTPPIITLLLPLLKLTAVSRPIKILLSPLVRFLGV